MSDNHQTIEDDAGNMISSIMQTMEQAAESPDIDAMMAELQATVDKVEEILVKHWLEVFEAFGWIGCVSGDDGDDGLVDEELDLSDVPEAER